MQRISRELDEGDVETTIHKLEAYRQASTRSSFPYNYLRPQTDSAPGQSATRSQCASASEVMSAGSGTPSSLGALLQRGSSLAPALRQRPRQCLARKTFSQRLAAIRATKCVPCCQAPSCTVTLSTHRSSKYSSYQSLTPALVRVPRALSQYRCSLLFDMAQRTTWHEAPRQDLPTRITQRSWLHGPS